MSSSRSHLTRIGFLVLVHVATFAPFLFLDPSGTPHRILHWDFASQFYPWLGYASDILRSGELPLWCPTVGGGTPFFLNPQGALWSPVTWLVAWTIGYTQHVAQIQSIAYILAGGIGAYVLSWSLFRSHPGALVTGLCFDLTMAVYGNLQHSPYIYAYGLMPWLFLAVRAVVEAGNRRSMAGLALVVYWLVVAGYPAIVFMEFVWAGAWAAFLLLERRKPGIDLKDRVLKGLGATVAGVGLAAIHWIPLVLHAREFTRGTALDLETALSGGNLRMTDLWNLFYPFLLWHPMPGPEADVSMRGLYMGAIAMPLVLIAWLRRQDRLTVGIGFFSFLTFLMACGIGFFGRTALHSVLPVLNFSRFPAGDSRTLMVLGLALLAGRGAEALASEGARHRRLTVVSYSTLLGVLLAGLVVLPPLVSAEALGRVVLDGITGPALGSLLVLGLVPWLGRRRFAWGLSALLALDLATAFGPNLRVAGEPPVQYDVQQARRHARISLEAASGPRQPGTLGSMDDLQVPGKCEPASDGFLSKDFYLGDYNPLRMERYEALLKSPARDWMISGPRMVFVPGETAPGDARALLDRARPVTHRLVRYGPNDVEASVTPPGSGWIVFNELYFPGWVVQAGTTETPMTEVAGGLRAVPVDGGTRRIVTRFRPRSLVIGAGVSLAFLIIGTMGLIRAGRHRPPDLTATGVAG